MPDDVGVGGMTYRGKVICICIVFCAVAWWLILLLVKLSIELLMPFLIWLDK